MYLYIIIIILIILIILFNNTKEEKFSISNESLQNIYGIYLNTLNKFNETDPNNNIIQYVDVCGNLNVNSTNSNLNANKLNTNILSLVGTDIRYYLRGCTIDNTNFITAQQQSYNSGNIDLQVGKYSTKYNNYFNAFTKYIIVYPGFGVHLYDQTDLEDNYSKAYNYSTEPLHLSIGELNKTGELNLYFMYPYDDESYIDNKNRLSKESILDFEIYPVPPTSISSIEVILLDLDKWKKHKI